MMDRTAAWKMGLTPALAALMDTCDSPQRKQSVTTVATARPSRARICVCKASLLAILARL
jgi:hypothetical protein